MRTALLLLFLLFPSLSLAAPIPGIVLRVVDGDTVSVRVDKEEVRVRLYGIDAPERKQPGGPEAQAFVEDLILTERVTLEQQGKPDRYGRLVAIIVLPDGSILQDKIVQAGHAWVYPQYCKAARCVRWQEMQDEAKRERRGLWGMDARPPWEWRRGKK